MKPGADEDRFDRVLRWMTENLEVGSGVYVTRDGELRVDPLLAVGANGHVVRGGYGQPPDHRDWLLNSSSALVACCYIDALGKVLGRGRKGANKSNLTRFKRFVRAHMPDFVTECRRRGGRYTISALYKTYRNGFVHQFADGAAHWGRRGRQAPYWFKRSGQPALNIDRLVQGLVSGIADFRGKFPVDRRNGKKPYANFARWLGV
jgi:hypothetical protein